MINLLATFQLRKWIHRESEGQEESFKIFFSIIFFCSIGFSNAIDLLIHFIKLSFSKTCPTIIGLTHFKHRIVCYDCIDRLCKSYVCCHQMNNLNKCLFPVTIIYSKLFLFLRRFSFHSSDFCFVLFKCCINWVMARACRVKLSGKVIKLPIVQCECNRLFDFAIKW